MLLHFVLTFLNVKKYDTGFTEFSFCLFAFTPHVGCYVNVCGKPVPQVVEGSIVMDSKVRGHSSSVSGHVAAAKRVIKMLRTSVDCCGKLP